MRKVFMFTFSWLALLSIVLAGCAPAATPVPAAIIAPEVIEATKVPEATKAPEVPAAVPAASDAPVKILVFSPQFPDQDLATNLTTIDIQQKFNVEFEWQTTTSDGNSAKEQRQISLASGDYPELYLLIPWVDQFSQIDLMRYGQQGVILPLNDLIDQYAPNLTAAIDSHPYFKAMTYAPDGKIYGVGQLVECFHCTYAYKMWVNTKWMNALGIDTPKTTDEFKAMLQAFKTKDPNGNGKADEVPLSGSIEDYGVRVIPYLMNGFIYDDDRSFLSLSGGQAKFVADQLAWRDGLRYIKTLYDAGLIDPGAFTQNADSFKKIGTNADAQILGAGAGMHPAIFTDIASDKYGADYDASPPVAGPNGIFATYVYPSVAGATFVLTNKASKEAQIAAIKMLDYMFTAEGSYLNMGKEGVDWRKPEAGEKALNLDVAAMLTPIEKPQDSNPLNSSWGAMAQYNNTKEVRDSIVASEDVYNMSGYERRLQDATNLMAPYTPKEIFPYWALWFDPAKADEAAMLRTNITDYVQQNSLEFVTGVKDLDKDWDEYVSGFAKLGLPGYVEMMQKAYDGAFK